MPAWIVGGLPSAKAVGFGSKVFLLFNLALTFYNAGSIWAHEIDIFRSCKLLDPGNFHAVQRVHWRKLPYWVLSHGQLLGAVALGADASCQY
jgi:hypothetical protein